MNLHISRVHINNFRNFHELDVTLSEKAVIVGENKSGKTNFIHALRLVLDPDLPDSARQLKEEDFWDGLESPMEEGSEISVSIDLQGLEESESLLAILSDYLIEDGDTPTARITYRYAPSANLREEEDDQQEVKYDFEIYGGDDPRNVFGYQQRKWMPLQVLPALRDAETDLGSWRRSPLRPLIERLSVTKEDLESAANKIDNATKEILGITDVGSLSRDIENRLGDMVGEFHSVSPSLGVASTDALRLLRSLRLFVDGTRKRTIADTSLGICNILYLTLLALELERKESAGERAATILAIEEPEAHLHPHLQRLVYRDFLRRKSSVLLTTHSPHVVSVSPIRSIVLLRDYGGQNGSKGTSTANAQLTEQQVQDLERYIDATRGEIFFARGVILVEGDAELYLVPAVADALRFPLDQRGISVCSVHGTDFAPYVRLLGKKSINIPFVVITDGDECATDDGFTYHGDRRGVELVKLWKSELVPELSKMFDEGEWGELDKQLNKLGIYVGARTLEIDLVTSGNGDEMMAAFNELGAGKVKQKRIRDTLFRIENTGNSERPSEDDILYILRRIEEYGKGRFAQRLAPKLKKANIPGYIENAIEHIVRLV